MRKVVASLCLLFIAAPRLSAADPRVDRWVQSLASADEHSRLIAGYELQPSLRRDEAPLVRALLPLVSNSHEAVRAYVASFLGEHRVLVSQSVPALVSLLEDPSPEVREHAAIALAQIGPPAVPNLLRELNLPRRPCAPPSDCRDYAYAALFEIGPVALPQIFSSFRSLNASAEGYSAALFRAFAAEKPEALVAGLLRPSGFKPVEIETLMNESMLPLVSPLLDRFAGSNPSQRGLAALALSMLYLRFVLEPTASDREFRDEADLFRRQYAQLVDPAAATAFLIGAIREPNNPRIARESIAQGLSGISKQESQRAIGEALTQVAASDREPWSLRTAAAQTLDNARLTEFFPVSTLRAILRDPSAPWPLKNAVATIAGHRGTGAASAAPELLSLVSTGDSDTLRLAAARALGHMGPPGVDSLAALLHSGNDHTRILAAFGIARSGSLGDSLLREASTDPSILVRQAGLIAAGTADPPARIVARYEPQAAPAQTATELVAPAKSTEHPLSGVPTQDLAQILSGKNPRDELEAAAELARRGPEGIGLLRPFVSGPSRFVSSAAISALSGAGKDSAPAVPELCNALLDNSLKTGAARALWNIGGYRGDCELMLATILKDGLIHDYITADLSALPRVEPWQAKTEPAPEVRADSFRVETLLLEPPNRTIANERYLSLLSSSLVAASPLPSLAMPPPSIWNTISLSLPADKSVYDAYTRIQAALADYHSFGLFAAPGGFTLVTRVEQIDPNWKPLPGEYRWRADRPSVSPLYPFSFFREMLFAPPGKFRMIAFMVTTDLKPEFSAEPWTEDEARKKFLQGAKVLPDSFSKIPYAGHYCHVLIYNYDKPLAKMAKVDNEGAGVGVAEVETQLTNAGIWNKLR
jgi:HEAT repeat protein